MVTESPSMPARGVRGWVKREAIGADVIQERRLLQISTSRTPGVEISGRDFQLTPFLRRIERRGITALKHLWLDEVVYRLADFFSRWPDVPQVNRRPLRSWPNGSVSRSMSRVPAKA